MDVVGTSDTKQYTQEQDLINNGELYDDNSSELYYTEESEDDDPTGFGLYGTITTAMFREALEESIASQNDPPQADTIEILLHQHYGDLIVYLESTETIETSGFPYIIMFHSFEKYATDLLCYTDLLFQSAQLYDGDICFAITDFTNYEAVLNYRPGSDAFWKRYEKLGFNKLQRPGVFAIDTDHRIYQFVGPLNADSIRKFSRQLISDELFKTEPIPEEDEEEFVRIGVAANFEELVIKSDIDVFLVLYSSSCPCSRALLPILDEVGRLLQDEDILVLKINAEANYLPLKYYAWYYPTIMFIRRDNKNNLIKYSGTSRTVKDFIKFIAKNATEDLLEFNRKGKEMFELREELFHFHERGRGVADNSTSMSSKTEENQPALKVISGKKRKSENCTSIQELSNLQTFINEFLQLMQQDEKFKPIEKCEVNTFPRHWEEISTEDFPKFNGINATDAFQRCKFGTHSFIIPPRCKFFNSNVDELTKLLPQLMPTSEFFDLIVLDPPWRNKYIRRLKRTKQELAYKMLNTDQLGQMPIAKLVHKQSILALWCTNSKDLQRAVVNELLPKWNLRVLHTLHWVKVNTKGKLIGPIDTSGMKKQPFEMIYLACHSESPKDFGIELQKVTGIFSIPSIVHSHKPPLLPWLKSILPDNPNCLEIFARYLQPQFTSIGLEVLKLMDERLYISNDKSVT